MYSIYEIIVLVLCLGLYFSSFLYSVIRPFIQERRLRRFEIAAELDILANKLCKDQRMKESHY